LILVAGNRFLCNPGVPSRHLKRKREKVRNSAYLPWACRKLGG
jgi:hypothetical protein